jgi:hypothetical protein
LRGRGREREEEGGRMGTAVGWNSNTEGVPKNQLTATEPIVGKEEGGNGGCVKGGYKSIQRV